jgi:hypothetical protein
VQTYHEVHRFHHKSALQPTDGGNSQGKIAAEDNDDIKTLKNKQS